MSGKFVTLMWSEYHDLRTGSSSRSFDSKDQADEYRDSHLDKVIEVAGESEATELIRAFNRLCAADWTPNQDREDREENSLIVAESMVIIKSYDSKSR